MPETLLESELFGHAKGAFTDAKSARGGLFVKANGGTLFLDEVGEMPLLLQAKLLRALQERKIRPVGSDEEISFDVRIVTATNRDLESAIEEKQFRDDLYYRLNVIHLELPPLRARGGDILLLAQFFLARHTASSGKAIRGIARPAAERLTNYFWPGNVRELQNCMERAVALASYEEIMVDDLPPKIRDYTPSHLVLATEEMSGLSTMEEVERRYVLKVMELVGNNKQRAAEILGFSRKTIYRKLERYGVVVGEDSEGS